MLVGRRTRLAATAAAASAGLFLSTALRLTRAMLTTTTPSSSAAATAAKPGALIFLHGLGDTPVGWSSLESQLPRVKSNLANIHYVFPPAPTLPVSIQGGMAMPSWFDLYDWPIAVGCRDDRENQIRAVEAVQDEIDKLVALGVDKRKIVVGGFSQGGAIGLLAAYHPRSRHAGVGGCVALSGWLTLTEELDKMPDAAKATKLFWGHGLLDDKVLFEHQAAGVNKLQQVGVTDIDFRQYPMGHGSDPDEIVAMAEFVEGIIFGGKEEEDVNEL